MPDNMRAERLSYPGAVGRWLGLASIEGDDVMRRCVRIGPQPLTHSACIRKYLFIKE